MRRFAVIICAVLVFGLAYGPVVQAHGRQVPPSKPPINYSCFYPAVVSNSNTFMVGSNKLGSIYVDLGHNSCSSPVYQSYASFDASGGNVTGCSSSGASLRVITYYWGNNTYDETNTTGSLTFGSSATFPYCGTSFLSESYTESPVSGTHVEVCVTASAAGGNQTTCTPTYTIP